MPHVRLALEFCLEVPNRQSDEREFYPTFIHNPTYILNDLIDLKIIPHRNVSKIPLGDESTGLITAQYQKMGSLRINRKGCCPTYAPVSGFGR